MFETVSLVSSCVTLPRSVVSTVESPPLDKITDTTDTTVVDQVVQLIAKSFSRTRESVVSVERVPPRAHTREATWENTEKGDRCG